MGAHSAVVTGIVAASWVFAAAATACGQEPVQAPPGMTTHLDPSGLLSIELPRGTKEVGADPKDKYQLQRWSLCWNEKPGAPFAHVYAKRVPEYARAPLCGYVRGRARYGERVDDSIKVDEHGYSEIRKFEGKGFFLYRVFEHEGQVYEVSVQARTDIFERNAAIFALLLNTAKVVGTPPAAEPPAGYRELEVRDCRVWTDAKPRDVERVTKEFLHAWDLMPEALPGERVIQDLPLLVVCSDDVDYDALWSGDGGSPDYSFVDGPLRATVVRLSKRRDADFAQGLHRSAAQHAIRSYFGGAPPPWIEDGLRMYLHFGVIASGKFEQPYKKAIETARDAARRRNALLTDVFAFGKADSVDRNNRDHELYAWHWYFRHGPGREAYGDLYDAHLDTLRKTGSVLDARKIWDQADMEVMRTSFLEWIEKWRK